MIKFGVQFYQEDFNLDEMKEAWQEAESLGFNSVWIYDHFYPMKLNSPGAILEAWTLLPILAAETSQIRLGVAMTCNSYRHPPILAKIATTVDIISGGRLEFGIGAGWFKDEHISYGIPFPAGKIRVEQLEESIEIIKNIWTQDKSNFKGNYYTISDLTSNPPPIQKPHPPIWIAGQRPKILKVVAKYADYLIITFHTPLEYEQRLDILRSHCNDLNRKFNDIEKSLYVKIAVEDNEEEAIRQAMNMKSEIVIKRRRDMNSQDYLDKVIVGTPNQCINRIQEYVDVGVSYFVLNFLSAPNLKPLQVFIDEVASSFR
jgi:F420-dependent oxidoreductase-like protein